MSERPEGPDPTPDFSPEAIAEALTQSELAERRRYVETRSARDHWSAAELELIDREARWIATVDKLRDHLPDQEHNEQAIRALQAQAAQLLAALEASEREYKDLAEHHRQCELAGTRLAELVKREVTGEGNLPPVDDNVLMEAVEVWDAHQWPALTPSPPPDLREDAP